MLEFQILLMLASLFHVQGGEKISFAKSEICRDLLIEYLIRMGSWKLRFVLVRNRFCFLPRSH